LNLNTFVLTNALLTVAVVGTHSAWANVKSRRPKQNALYAFPVFFVKGNGQEVGLNARYAELVFASEKKQDAFFE
jgi:hypothetical protein